MASLIDSDWVIDYLEGGETAITLLERLAPDEISISMVTYMEVYQGTLRSDDPEGAQAKLADFLTSVPILPFSRRVAEVSASLREVLAGQGKRVRARALDLINAATAIEYNLTLVTRNLGDYDDVPGLQLYEANQAPPL
jgi:tRNA(fMet)-specific endonuclease VapC